MPYNPNKPMQVGGQAVIEGVMMRCPGKIATAVRRSDKSITIKSQVFKSLVERYPKLNIPVIRGGIALIEMMIIGIKTLNFSADIAMEDIEEKERQKAEAEGREVKAKKKKSGNSTFGTVLTLLVAFAIAMLLFFATPLYTATALFNIEQQPLAFNLIAGFIRISILLGYLYVISRMKDVQRLFQYHGAEHKAVFAFEKGLDLTVEHTRSQSRFHPRCGTSFVLQVAIVAILCFAIIDWLLILWLGEITLLIRLVTHLPLIPFVAGVSYEALKMSAKYNDTPAGRIVVAPGLWLQRITTREPDDSQIEVAIAALNAALGKEEELLTEQPLEAVA
jgi:uncharacterized protein YqhQ